MRGSRRSVVKGDRGAVARAQRQRFQRQRPGPPCRLAEMADVLFLVTQLAGLDMRKIEHQRKAAAAALTRRHSDGGAERAHLAFAPGDVGAL